jgi:hypothetical protein
VCYDGTIAATEFFTDLFNPEHGHEFRLVPVRANGRPAAANYFCETGQQEFRAFSIDVLNIVDRQLIDVTTFFVPEMFPLFGLPPVL